MRVAFFFFLISFDGFKLPRISCIFSSEKIVRSNLRKGRKQYKLSVQFHVDLHDIKVLTS